MQTLILGNDPKTMVNFRGPLIEAMLAAGHRVTVAGSGSDAKLLPWFAARGVSYIDVPIERNGLSLLTDWRTFGAFMRVIRGVKPDLVFTYSIKPVIYGLLASRLAGVARRTAMITGLGYAFTDGGAEGLRARWKRRVVSLAARQAYAVALSQADAVVFQNPDDRDVFLNLGLVKRRQVGLVNGSGVDLEHFRPAPMPEGATTFLMIARLLRDKGVYEYVEAARLAKRARPDVRFRLVGPFDSNPTSVKPAEVEAWVREGIIDYRGAVDDVRPEIAAAHVFVLPSYREGTPRTVLEAMAMGRPVITTDVPGCRETVVHGENGLLVAARDAKALAGAMEGVLDPTVRGRMASAALSRVRSRFDKNAVALATLDAVAGRAMLETSVVATGARPSFADRSDAGPNTREPLVR